MENEPFQRKTKLREFLVKDLATPSVSDEAESDQETEILASSASAVSTCLVRDGDDDDVFHRESVVNKFEHSALDHPATDGTLDVARSSNSADSLTNTSNYETWEDEFKDECDDEVLAWALESPQQVNQEINTSCQGPQWLSSTGNAYNYKTNEDAKNGSSDYLLERTGPRNNAVIDGRFQIARTNLDIKKENRYSMECGMEVNSHSSIAPDSSQNAVLSDNFLAPSHSASVKSEQQDEAGGGIVQFSSGQFSGSLSGLACSGRNTFSSTFYQGSPVTNSTGALDENSPKTCSRRFSESSGFPTPPQTPSNVRTSTTSPHIHLSNTFPRRSVSQRAQFSNFGKTPAKTRRRSFTAKYDARCDLCKNSISAGVDEITHFNNGSHKSWVHQKCVQYN